MGASLSYPAHNPQLCPDMLLDPCNVHTECEKISDLLRFPFCSPSSSQSHRMCWGGLAPSWLWDFSRSLTSWSLSVFICEIGTITELPLWGGTDRSSCLSITWAKPGVCRHSGPGWELDLHPWAAAAAVSRQAPCGLLDCAHPQHPGLRCSRESARHNIQRPTWAQGSCWASPWFLPL